MAITFPCPCGALFTVPDELAGLRAPCPACHALLVVPDSPDDDDEPVTDLDVDEEETATPYGLADEAGSAVDDEPEVVEEAEPEEIEDDVEVVEDVEPNDDGSPEYFVAAYPPGATLRHPKTFRFYLYGNELLVLHAGPFGWPLVGTLTDRPGVRETVHRGDVGLGGGPLGSDTDAIVRKQLAQRAAVLDRMTLGELRAEADSDKVSFRVTAENTPKARIEPPPRFDPDDPRPVHLISARLKFSHATAGKWDLVILSPVEARMAMRAFRRVLGHDNVEVTLRLK